MSGYNIKELVQEAQFRWLRPAEVLFILQNYEETQLNHEPPQKPPSGSLFLFNKRALRFFRKDGHNWRRKKDPKNVGEAHERLKVGNDEALNCYYAHSEDNPHFRRRSYWMLNPAMEHIVLVHYRDTTIGKHSAGLQGFHLGSIDESADEDIAKVSKVKMKTLQTCFNDSNHGQGNFYENLSHELFYYIQGLRGTHSYSLEQGSSYIHDGNLSGEVGGVGGQAPSIGDMVWDNMSSGSTHSYSHDGSAPTCNDLFNRDLSTTMTESDNLQDILWEEFEQMRIESNNFDF